MSHPTVSVCICTYKRPQLLKRSLKELCRLDTGGILGYSIVVADNDHLESARQIVSDCVATFPIKITYCVETRQNIALARNKALAHAEGDFVAFIDDDEYPVRSWLLTLYRTCELCGVDGVLGPVKPCFEQTPPKWVARGRFFDRPTHNTGFVIDWTEGRTGNVLFRRRILNGVDEPFRAKFGSGGEDRDFFRRMIERGCIFAWCDEAVVHEVVPPVRWKRTFMLKRALLRGKVSLSHKNAGTRDVAKSALAIPLYSLALPFLLVVGHHRFMKYLIKLFDHAGRILAFLGFNPVRETYVTE